MGTRQSRKLIWDMINTLFLTTAAVEPFVELFPTTFLEIAVYNYEKKELKVSKQYIC